MKTLLISCMVISWFLAMVFLTMSEALLTKKDKKSCFECGFENLSEKKMSFSTNFLMLMLMFLIFDVEISILIPFLMMNKNNQSSMMIVSSIFIIFLVSLTLKEWKQGSLEWAK